jgi:hypothetical protein
MVATEGKSLFQELADLQQLANDYDDDVRSKLTEARKSLDERNAVLSRIKELTEQAMSTTVEQELAKTPSMPKPAAALPKKKGGTVSAGVTPKTKQVMNPAIQKRQGSAAVAPKVQPVAKKDQSFEQEITLPEAVWDALDRDIMSYASIVEGYEPDDYGGLKTSEIKEVLDHEKKWVSSSPNPSSQIQQTIGELRHEGKLARNEATKRYYIVDGAELYGPPLNVDGKPMTEMTDGTFQTADGETFTWNDGSVYKGRKKKGKSSTEENGEAEQEEQQTEE